MTKTTKTISYQDAMNKVNAILAKGNGTAKVADLKKDAIIRGYFMLKSKMTVKEVVDTIGNGIFSDRFTFTKKGRSVVFTLANAEVKAEPKFIKAAVKVEKKTVEVVAPVVKVEKVIVSDEDKKALRAAFDKTADWVYAHIYKMRNVLGWDSKKFDEVLRQVRNEGLITMTIANHSEMTDEAWAANFIDEVLYHWAKFLSKHHNDFSKRFVADFQRVLIHPSFPSFYGREMRISPVKFAFAFRTCYSVVNLHELIKWGGSNTQG